MRSFNKKGEKLDDLIISEEIRLGSGASMDKFNFSLINRDSIKVFNYESLKESIENKNTKVVIAHYVVDSNGYFNKVSTDSLYLSGLLSKYTKFDVEPEVDDPVYKYWTLR